MRARVEQGRLVVEEPTALPEGTVVELGGGGAASDLRGVIDRCTFGTVWWDLDGGLFDANEAFLAMIGGSRGDLEAGRLDWRVMTPPEWAERDERALRQLRERGSVDPFEKELLHRDGTRIPVMVASTTLSTTARRGLAFVVDLTRRKRAEERERRVGRFRDTFLALLGHDLRNPLGAIKMWATVIVRTAQEDRVRTGALRIIDSVDRTVRMVNQLLDTARARMFDGFPLAPRHVALVDLVREVTAELAALYPDRQVRLTAHGDPSGCWDPDRVTQVLHNLVGNACQHGAPDAPIEIEVVGGSVTCIEVRNRGPRIPEDVLGQLFEPFRQHRERHGSRGLGLGLFISSEIARAHGGRLVASSTDEQTAFRLELPSST